MPRLVLFGCYTPKLPLHTQQTLFGIMNLRSVTQQPTHNEITRYPDTHQLQPVPYEKSLWYVEGGRVDNLK